MPTASPSLTLRALFSRAAARAGLDVSAPMLAGLTPAAKALAVVVGARLQGGVTLLVAPTDKDVEQLTADARFFYASLEGTSEEATEQAVLPLPSLQVDPYRGMTPHFRVAAARARALVGAAAGTARLIVTSAAALLPTVSPPDRLLRAARELRAGSEIDPQTLADLLVDAGFSRADPVDEHGAFAVRGGIVDVFPASDSEPVRLEFVGDMVETLRRFDPTTQRSTAAIDYVSIVPVRERFDDDQGISILDFLATAHGVRVVLSERDEVEQQARKLREQLDASYTDAGARGHVVSATPDEAFTTWEAIEPRLASARRVEELAVEGDDDHQRVRHVSCQPALEFRGRAGDWIADLRQARQRGDTVLFVADSPGRAERTVEILQEYEIVAVPVEHAEDVHAATVLVAVGSLSRGFRLAEGALQLYAETDVFEEERRPAEKRRNLAKTFLSDLRDLKVGDLIVHVDHGIGEFVGLKQLGTVSRPVAGSAADVQEFLEIRYAGDDKLFVPVERLDLIQKYTGGTRPALDRLGGTTWEKAKTRVKKAMRDMAEELLKLYAQRRAVPGHAFAADTHWQEEFESAFPYEMTPDQATAITDIKRDMESSTPMDRLLCGDVGYGKTEVAMRAAFKAVMDGKQVAVLAPTTVLAFQHEKTVRERFAGFPVTVDMVSRFRSPKETKQILAGVGAREGRHHRRHAPPAVEGRAVQGPRPAGGRRGTALRGVAQRTHQADAQEGGRPDDDGHADSADAQHVAGRDPRHVDHRDSAEGSPVDPDQRREVRRAHHRARDSQ
jgi:transcription-repair coupling factor (superfamily II helicase)